VRKLAETGVCCQATLAAKIKSILCRLGIASTAFSELAEELGCGIGCQQAIQSILRSNIPNGPLASVSESAVRSVQRFYTLSFTEIFPSGPFTAKLFFAFTRLTLEPRQNSLHFAMQRHCKVKKESPHAKLLPSLEIGCKNTFLLPFGIILAQTRASTKKEEKLCLEKD
jgi:hypothetical protein